MKGVLLFAYNNGITDYLEMAVRTAKRVNQFLKLPVSIVTDIIDIEKYPNVFDKIITSIPDTSNTRDKKVWINKGRYNAYNFTPYDETLILDTDYLINSDMLLKPFDMYDDFMCHNHATYIGSRNIDIELVSNTFLETYWATVIYFKKTKRTKQIFECMKLVQDNYMFYVNLFGINNTMYRNDYSLTIALWIVNGHSINKQDFIPWNLLHLEQNIKAHHIVDNQYLFFTGDKKYITLKNTDFHIMDKKIFMELTNE